MISGAEKMDSGCRNKNVVIVLCLICVYVMYTNIFFSNSAVPNPLPPHPSELNFSYTNLHDRLITSLKSFRIKSRDVSELRFLLYGPIGAGKSNSILIRNFQYQLKEYYNYCYYLQYEKYSVGNVPFAFYDVMGLEEGQYKGVHKGDIISALKGHLPNNYKFKTNAPINADNRRYIDNPTLNDQIHCLVSVIPADKISMMDDEVIQKMKEIRAAATKLGVPQMLFLTRVDKVCTMTQRDVAKVYQSKKIKEKMMECSGRLGFSMNCIFPVKNYSEETRPNEKLNCLMLEAVNHIVQAANDFVKKISAH
uniref:G domain-containing protein n=1 Tax=Astyanax mexicanus TaxID=7994 RepID=A0A3B1JFH2_ASTMX